MRKSYIREKKIRCGDEYMAVGVYAVTDQEHRKRGKKREESDKGQKNRNKAASMRKKQRKVLANFDKRGFFLTGTYEDCYLPDDEDACWKDVENYARRVKYATRKRFGVEKEKIRLMLWAVLLTAAANAAALVPDTDRDSGQSVPTVLMEPQSEDERPEVVLDGSGTVQEKHRVEAAAETGCLYAAERGRGAIRRGGWRRQERRTGDRGAAAGGRAALPRTDRAKDLPAAFRADRQDDAVLQAGLPEGAVQRVQPCVNLPQRGEDLFWIHVPHAGQVQLPRQSL